MFNGALHIHNEAEMPKKKHDCLKRLAAAILPQLPDNTVDAMVVLDHLREFVRFMEVRAPGGGALSSPSSEPSSDNVTAFPAASNSR